MKQLRKAALALMLTGFVGAAQAGLIEFSQTLTSLGNLSQTQASYTHDLKMASPTAYDASLYEFVSGMLSLTFATSNNGAARNDIISIFLDGNSANFSGTAINLNAAPFDVSGFFDSDLGTLSVAFSRAGSGGNIALNQSTLTVTANQRIVVPNPGPGDAVAVPTPGTLVLMGLGLLGAAFMRRRGPALRAAAAAG